MALASMAVLRGGSARRASTYEEARTVLASRTAAHTHTPGLCPHHKENI